MSLLDGPQRRLNYGSGHLIASGRTCRLSTSGRDVIICNSNTETGLVYLPHTQATAKLNVLINNKKDRLNSLILASVSNVLPCLPCIKVNN